MPHDLLVIKRDRHGLLNQLIHINHHARCRLNPVLLKNFKPLMPFVTDLRGNMASLFLNCALNMPPPALP